MDWGMNYEQDLTMERRMKAKDEVIVEYIELLEAMKRRDPNLDPIWMEQYATKKLAELKGG